MNKLMNALGFQAGWWACIAGIGHGFEIEAILFCSILISIHLYISESPIQEIKLGVFAVLIGIVVDSSLQHLSVVSFYGLALRPLSPFWLWMLWVMFSLTLNSSLAFLKEQSFIASAAIGSVFGPLTYYAGAKLGAASLDVSPEHIVFLAVAWMLAMPLLLMAAKHTSHISKDDT